MPDVFSAINPAAAGFDNPYEKEYANYLATSPADPSPYQMLNGAALRNRAGTSGTGNYLQALKDAQEYNLRGSSRQEQGKETVAAIAGLSTMHSRYGGADRFVIPYLTQPDMLTGERIMDPNAAERAAANNDSISNDRLSAEAYRDRATGVKDVADAGFAPNYLDVSKTLGGANDVNPIQYNKYITPANQAELDKAMAAVTTSHASMIRANKGVGDGGGGGGTTTVNLGPVSGMDTVSVKQGKHESTAAYHVRLALERKAHEAAGGPSNVSPATRPGYLGSDNKWHIQ